MIETYDQRRRYLIPKLRELGFGITVEPTGAFYILANAKRFSNDSYHFAFDILKEAKVGVTPGIDFGTNAEGYLRFSYANSMENIVEGMNRLERYLEKYAVQEGLRHSGFQMEYLKSVWVGRTPITQEPILYQVVLKLVSFPGVENAHARRPVSSRFRNRFRDSCNARRIEKRTMGVQRACYNPITRLRGQYARFAILDC